MHVLTDGSPCTYLTELEPPREQECLRRHLRASHELETAGCPVIPLSGYVGRFRDEAAGEWECRVADVAAGRWPLREVEYAGIRLWDVVKGSVAAHAQLPDTPLDPEDLAPDDRDLMLAFSRAAIGYMMALDALYDELAVTHVLVFNGLYYLERIATELALRRGIRVIVTESSCFRDRKYFIPVHSITEIRENFKRRALAALDGGYDVPLERRSALQSYLEGVYAGTNNWILQPGAGVDVRSALQIPPNARVCVFLSQVPQDSVLTYDTGAPKLLDAILQTVEFVQRRPGWHLVIRLHPGGTNTALRRDHLADRLNAIGLPRTVSLVTCRQLNTYDIMKVADCGVTVSSQAGLEMLSLYKPVVVLGHPFYRGLGVTYDVAPSSRRYETTLTEAMSHVPSEAWRLRIERLMCFFIFDYLIAVDRDKKVFTNDGLQRVLEMFRN